MYQRIRDLREDRDLMQKDLAAYLKCTQVVIPITKLESVISRPMCSRRFPYTMIQVLTISLV